MIETMSDFYFYLGLLKESQPELIGTVNLIEVLIEVLELRILRIENFLGIPIPDDLVRVRLVEGRRHVKREGVGV